MVYLFLLIIFPLSVRENCFSKMIVRGTSNPLNFFSSNFLILSPYGSSVRLARPLWFKRPLGPIKNIIFP